MRPALEHGCGKQTLIAFYFGIRIWYMFEIWKCRGESGVGQCTISVLAKRLLLLNGKFRWILQPMACFNRKSNQAVAISVQMRRLCTDLDPNLLYIWQNWTEILNAALNVCFWQPCSSAGRMFFTSRSRLDSCWQIVSFPQNAFDEMICRLGSTENSCSFGKYPPMP